MASGISAELIEAQYAALERIALGELLETTLDALLRDVERLDASMLTSVLLLDEDGRHMGHGAAPRLPPEYVRAIDGSPIGPAAGSCGTAAYLREQVIVEDIATDALWQDYRALALQHGLRACWSTPIVDAEGILSGTFAIYYGEPKAPQPRHLELIAAITRTVAVAIQCERTKRAIRESEARLDAAQHSARIGSWELDVASDALHWSREMLHLFGVAPGKGSQFSAEFAEHVHPEDRALLVQAYQRARSDGEAGALDFRTNPAAGPLRVLHARFNPERDASGKIWRLAGTLQDVTERKEIEAELRGSLARQRELAQRLELLEEQERRKIGQELHDRIGQALAVAKLNLEIIADQIDARAQDAVGKRLEDTRALLQEAIDQSRDIVAELRPPGLDEHGLRAALEQLAETWSARLAIPVRVSGAALARQISPLVDTALLRIAQEALANAAKHAGARRIELVLAAGKDGLLLEIRDDGRGFVPTASAAESHGLQIMRERAEAVGAQVDVDSRPGHGTRVVVRVPRRA
jgi:PAS domain S-box-containing protein